MHAVRLLAEAAAWAVVGLTTVLLITQAIGWSKSMLVAVAGVDRGHRRAVALVAIFGRVWSNWPLTGAALVVAAASVVVIAPALRRRHPPSGEPAKRPVRTPGRPPRASTRPVSSATAARPGGGRHRDRLEAGVRLQRVAVLDHVGHARRPGRQDDAAEASTSAISATLSGLAEAQTIASPLRRRPTARSACSSTARRCHRPPGRRGRRARPGRTAGPRRCPAPPRSGPAPVMTTLKSTSARESSA